MKKVLLLLILLFFFSGCAVHGTEEQLMVVSLGIDQTAGGFGITVKMPGFSGASSDDHNGEKNYISLTASGKTLPDAFHLLQTLSPRALNFSQTRQILLSDALTIPLSDTLRFLKQIDNIRSQALLAICKGSAKDLIENQKAMIGSRLSRYIDTTLQTAVRQGNIPPSTLACVLNSIYDRDQDLLLAAVQKNVHSSAREETEVFASEDQPFPSSAISGTYMDYAGSAAMNKDQPAGTLSAEETQLCRFLLRKTGAISFSSSVGYVTLTARIGPYFDIIKEEDRLTLSVRGNINVLPHMDVHVNTDQICRELTDSVILLLKTLQNLRCDALGFGGLYVRSYETIQEWEQCRWKIMYQNAAVQVHFTITLMDEA